jgi:Family of unknown function (DUF6088)
MKSVRKMHTNTGQPRQAHRGPALDLKARVLDHMRQAFPASVWTPSDFLGFGSRAAIDKALQRLAIIDKIRRIDRGLYDLPRINKLTGKPANPDYTAVIDAVARRDQARLLVDGITAANQLGLTNAVPARVTVHTDARIRPIRLGNMTINFKLTAPSRLYWAGRPAMRIVQALHWLRDMLPSDRDSIQARLKAILNDPTHGPTIRDDLQTGLHTMPQWMHEMIKNLLIRTTAGQSDLATYSFSLSSASGKARGTKNRRRPKNQS